MASKKDQDKLVLKLRTKLLQQEAELISAEKPVYITSGLFRANPHSDRGIIDIKSASQAQLIIATEAIIHKKAAFDILGIEPGKHIGSTLIEWIDDFKTRIGVLNKNIILAKVRATQQKIETQLLSATQKRGIALEDVAADVEELTSTK